MSKQTFGSPKFCQLSRKSTEQGGAAAGTAPIKRQTFANQLINPPFKGSKQDDCGDVNPNFWIRNFFNNYWAPGNNWIPAIILLVRPIQSSASFLKHSRQWCCCPSPATNKWVVAPSKQNLFNTWKASATWNHIQPKGKFQRTNPHHRMWVPSSISPTTKRKKKKIIDLGRILVATM